ncbi:hypothetical protein AB5I41_22860 [Sphingomonas sp. MMS24-JH45]
MIAMSRSASPRRSGAMGGMGMGIGDDAIGTGGGMPGAMATAGLSMATGASAARRTSALDAGPAREDDILVIARPENVRLFNALSDYQFSLYLRQYGDIGYTQGAQWASAVRSDATPRILR